MKLFINYVTDRAIYHRESLLVIEDLRCLKNNVESIIVLNYPGSYTNIRKSIAMAKAIAVCNENVSLYGFSLFEYLNHYGKHSFYVEKYMYWKENTMGLFSELKSQDVRYVSNRETEISDVIDCSSQEIMKFIDNNNLHLKDLKQIYFDKFSL